MSVASAFSLTPEDVWEKYPPRLIGIWFEELSKKEIRRQIFEARCAGATVDDPEFDRPQPRARGGGEDPEFEKFKEAFERDRERFRRAAFNSGGEGVDRQKLTIPMSGTMH